MSQYEPFTVELDDSVSVKAYLTPEGSDLPLEHSVLRILREDMVRPEIAISLVEAALRLDPEVLEDAKAARIGLRNFYTFLKAERLPTGMTEEEAKKWTNWCVAIRVVTHLGEWRESCYDPIEGEWVCPWFDLDTGVPLK
jgi:hypothetical protein